MAAFGAFVQRAVGPLVLALVAMFALGVMLGLGSLFRDAINPPREQVLTPLPDGVPDATPERPEFTMQDLPRAPGR